MTDLILELATKLSSTLTERANRDYPQIQTSFSVSKGKRYLKVIKTTLGANSVHCFIDSNTGDVYKAASWQAPAKGVRYNLLRKDSQEACFNRADPCGGYLYAR